MWARGRYDLGLSSAEFFALTPRQYCMLMDRRREHLAHVELVHAWTTAAVINNGMYRPEEPASALTYMPHHRESTNSAKAPELTEEQLERISDYNVRVAELALEQREQALRAG